jgi:hypothetical protein
MRRAAGSPLLAWACLLLAGTGRAEVRLESHGSSAPTVRVDATPAGPWSPVRAVGARTLNPSGDRVGDGSPRFATGRDRVLVAWRRGDGRVAVSVGAWSWSTITEDASTDAVEILPFALDEGFAIVAQTHDRGGAPAIAVSGASSDGAMGPSIVVAEGALIGAARLRANSLGLVSILAPGELVFTHVVFAITPSPTPIPFPERSVRLHTVSPTPIPFPVVGASSTRAVPQLSYAVQLSTEERRDGESVTLVTWWPTPSELRYVAVNASGAASPVRSLVARGNSAYSPSLLEQARHAVRDGE